MLGRALDFFSCLFWEGALFGDLHTVHSSAFGGLFCVIDWEIVLVLFPRQICLSRMKRVDDRRKKEVNEEKVEIRKIGYSLRGKLEGGN